MADKWMRWISSIKRFGNWVGVGIILGLGFFLAFALIAKDLIENELNVFDQIIIIAVSTINSPLTTEIMKGITMLGSATAMITIVVVAWLGCIRFKKYLWDTAAVTIVLTVTWLMNWLLKWMFHRDRPYEFRMIEATGYSFPSGHAMISLAFYGMLGYLLWINLKSRWAKYLTISFLFFMVLAIGTSRVYLGVHYPSDVAAGFAAGGIMLIGSILGLQVVRSTRY